MTKTYEAGFGYVDESVSRTSENVFEYGVFPLIEGKPARQPSATSIWRRGSDVDLDVGLRPEENVWNPDMHEAAFALDLATVVNKSLRYGFMEQRAGQSPDARPILSTASPMKLDHKFLCYRPRKMDTDTVLLIIEDKFGFRTTSSMQIPVGRTYRTQGYAMPSVCGGPAVMVPVAPSHPPPPPPQAR